MDKLPISFGKNVALVPAWPVRFTRDSVVRRARREGAVLKSAACAHPRRTRAADITVPLSRSARADSSAMEQRWASV
jgi:hypothetical protein